MKDKQETRKATETPAADDQAVSIGFAGLGLCPQLVAAVQKMGWAAPTPIQEEAIPIALSGQDVFGVAQTGTGKTGAFVLPILQKLLELGPAPGLSPYCVVLAPTRELVQQIAGQFEALSAGSAIRVITAYGGTSDRPQTKALSEGIEIIVGAPGRVMDLMRQGYLQFNHLVFNVLDEADRMFDMGFIDDIRTILNRMPSRRQTMMFSATLMPAVKRVAQDYLFYPAEIRIGRIAPPKELCHELWLLPEEGKPAALDDLLQGDYSSVVVFSRTKKGTSELAQRLSRKGVSVASIHADRLQRDREKALASFRAGGVRVLVATDVASRGLDIEDIGLVVNYDLPRDPEDYVHRVGRTARVHKTGLAVTFVTPDEERYAVNIERFIGSQIVRRRYTRAGIEASAAAPDRQQQSPSPSPASPDSKPRRQSSRRGGRGGRSRGGRVNPPKRD